MFVLFVAQHLAALLLALLVAAGAGTLLLGTRGDTLAGRCALGLAVCAQLLFLLGISGQLRAMPMLLLAVIAIGGGAARGLFRERPRGVILAAIVAAPLFVLSLAPPIRFDETLYHLPFVRAFAAAGAVELLPSLRFPAFPQLHELLAVPLLLLVGDTATHLVALLEVLVTAALLAAWGRESNLRAGWLAAALFLGSPLVVQLATILYVEASLMLFVTAGFFAITRKRYALAGFFLGTACGVKYLAGFFAIAGLLYVLARASERRRAVGRFVLACAAAAVPTLLWIWLATGDPLFPFLIESAWTLPGSTPMPFLERALAIARVPWDVTFARERMNVQPPITPWLIPMLLLFAFAAIRDRRAGGMLLLIGCYLVAFSFLPQDARYLASLLPLASITAAMLAAERWPRAVPLLAILAIAPGAAYAGYRIVLQGMPPHDAATRDAWLAQRVPEYRALLRAGTEHTYVCGAEQLKSHARGELLGDHAGLHPYREIVDGADGTSALARRLRAIDVRYFLLARKKCTAPRADGGMELVYEDASAQLWRVTRDDAGSGR